MIQAKAMIQNLSQLEVSQSAQINRTKVRIQSAVFVIWVNDTFFFYIPDSSFFSDHLHGWAWLLVSRPQ